MAISVNNCLADASQQAVRFIGLDFGDKTIGVAVSCPEGRVATGLTTIFRSQPEALRPSIDKLREIITQYKATHIVLGYPVHMDGSNSHRAGLTLAFRDKLRRNFKSIEIILWDERLSTQAVTRAFFSDSTRSKKRREAYNNHVDEMAAVYILQGFLDKKRMEETMENETIMPDDYDDDDNVIIMSDEDGNEHQLHVLASKEGADCIYLLVAIADDESDTSEVLHFKCPAIEEDESDDDADEDDEMALELVDETHEDFDLVMALFKADYEELGITIDEEDPLLGT